jgi:shikimate dehydrogenase
VWAAVLGSPIGHSLSPVLHRAAYAELGLSDWRYDAIECTTEGLPEQIDRARNDPDFGGFSLTMPLKVAVLPLLDELLPLAERTQAVNTVVRREGRLFGANTDVPGLVGSLADAGFARPKHPVVLGAGGSARAAIAALAQLGASRMRAGSRSAERAAGLHAVAEASGIRLDVVPFGSELIDGADLVISTVPAEASQELAGWDVSWQPGALLFDLLYAPWPTPFAVAAGAAGVRILGGLELLAQQAVGQVALMTGLDVDVAILRNAGEGELAAR